MTEIDPILIRKWRKGIGSASFCLLPDGRQYMIMWRHFDQFGVRQLETGEQYAFTYEDAIRTGVRPLILCPMIMESVVL